MWLSWDVGSSPSWVVLDARIMSWLLGSVEPHIVTHLRPHRFAQSMRAYLKKVYHQDNDAHRFHSETETVAYAAQGCGPPMHLKNLQCFCCKEYGHIAQAFQTSVIIPPVATSAVHNSPSAACFVPAPDYCTPEMVQRMLISALSTMGFQGNNFTKLWCVDLGASNHMTNNPTALCHVRPYAGQSSIHTANGSSLLIAAIDDASSKYTDVFLAPQLSMNLISVGQLVDNIALLIFLVMVVLYRTK
ncbi:hypothetical protein CK203_030228 [Vitis vinifera]|uniref:Retrovirus-related Pol polyprotein from transposon TNT 1-94-like beta-barrel domain-containing protein n=1 Tax=Vitis vinifera TaxID=29760 RepID=A0A438I5I5_VITVI|nr:hypothetical protein CK203_030228 [Vitis vinifera]